MRTCDASAPCGLGKSALDGNTPYRLAVPSPWGKLVDPFNKNIHSFRSLLGVAGVRSAICALVVRFRGWCTILQSHPHQAAAVAGALPSAHRASVVPSGHDSGVACADIPRLPCVDVTTNFRVAGHGQPCPGIKAAINATHRPNAFACISRDDTLDKCALFALARIRHSRGVHHFQN